MGAALCYYLNITPNMQELVSLYHPNKRSIIHLRACLTSLSTPAGGPFAAILREIFLEAAKDSCGNLPCLAAKFPAINT